MTIGGRRARWTGLRDFALGALVIAAGSWAQIHVAGQTPVIIPFQISDVAGHRFPGGAASITAKIIPRPAVPTSISFTGGKLLYSSSYDNVVAEFGPIGVSGSVPLVDRLNLDGTDGDIVRASLVVPGVCPDQVRQCTFFVDDADCSVKYFDNETREADRTILRLTGAGCTGGGAVGQLRLDARYTRITGFGEVDLKYFVATPGYIVHVPLTGVTTVAAGTGSAQGSTDDGIPAINAQVAEPTGVIRARPTLPPDRSDLAGPSANDGFVFADRLGHRVRHVNNAGIITTIAGNRLTGPPDHGDGGQATAASVSSPTCVLPHNGRFYICQAGSIREVDATSGVISTVVGKTQGPQLPGVPAAHVTAGNPGDVAFDNASVMYFSDKFNARMNARDAGGMFRILFGTPLNQTSTWFYYNGEDVPADMASFGSPTDVAVIPNPDGSRTLLTPDAFDNRVRAVNLSTGLVTTFAGDGATFGPADDNGPATGAFINRPFAVQRRPNGHVLVSEQFGCRIRNIDLDGIITTIAGTGGCLPINISATGPATSINLDQVRGVATDTAGNIYWAESSNIIRMMTPGGILSRVAGNGTTIASGDGGFARDAGIPSPFGLDVEPDGSALYIAHGNVVRRVNLTITPATISTLAGTGGAGYTGDGGPAAAAMLRGPTGVEVVGETLLVADAGNHAVRRISGIHGGAPTIETIAGTGVPGHGGRGGIADGVQVDGPLATTARMYGVSATATTADGTIYFSEAQGQRLGSLVPVTPPTGPPGAPGTPVASVNGNIVTFSWTPPAAGGTPFSYTLLARLTAGGPVVATLAVGAATSFTVAAPDGTFVVSIQATNAQGTGPESGPVTFGVPGVPASPGPPSNLAANVTGSTVAFTWVPPATGGAPGNYNLRAASTPGGAPFVTLPIAAQTDAADRAAAAVTRFTVTAVPAGTYYVTINAQNLGGTSATSNEVTVTVSGPAPPNAPVLNPAQVSGTTVTLTWAPAATGATATGYVVYASLSPGGAVIATLAVAGPTLTVASVPPGTYFVTVRAVNANGASPASNEVTAVVQ